MKSLLIIVATLWQAWRLRTLDEDDILDAQLFKREWDSSTDEERNRMVARLLFDYHDRSGTLKSSSQQAGATANVITMLIVAVGLALQNKFNLLQSFEVKATAWLIAVAVMALNGSYLPKVIKAWTSSFDGAGKHAARAKPSDYASAELLRHDVFVRNRNAQRSKRGLSAAKVLINLVVIVIASQITS